jgi:CubicO group peptidase (beta-lactamase class C family)
MTRVLGLAVLVTLAGCEKGGTKLLGPQGPTVDLSILDNRLKTALDTTTVGYAFVISQNGQMARNRQVGWARTVADGGIAQSIDRRMVIFSLSKVLTATAALRLIEQRGLTVDSMIGPWLPPQWNAPLSVRSLTFRQLLSHRSGLRSTLQSPELTQSWAGMRDSIANGTPLPKTYTYQNLNFALFQVIIPALWRGQPGGPAADLVLDESTTSFWYRWYVVSQLLEPAGIDGVDCTFADRETATRFYSRDGSGGFDPDNRTLWCASGGWYLSAREMAQLVAHLRHTNTLLTANQRQVMDNGLLGWDGPSALSGAHGSYYTKNGSRSYNGGTHGGLSQVMVFPATGVEVVVFVNSRSTNEWNLGTLIRGAYEAAVTN